MTLTKAEMTSHHKLKTICLHNISTLNLSVDSVLYVFRIIGIYIFQLCRAKRISKWPCVKRYDRLSCLTSH